MSSDFVPSSLKNPVTTLIMTRCDACCVCKERARAGKDEQTEASSSMQVGAVLRTKGSPILPTTERKKISGHQPGTLVQRDILPASSLPAKCVRRAVTIL